MRKTITLILLGLLCSVGNVWAVDIYSTDVKATPETPATATSATGSFATTALSWASDYAYSFKTSGSAGYYTLNFSPALSLTAYTNVKVKVYWGAENNRPLNISVNGGSNTKIDEVTESGQRSKVRDAEGSISVTSLTSIKFVSSGGGAVAFFRVEITGSIAEPHTVTFNAGSYGTCGKTSLTEESVGAGVTLPAVTANTGYTFNGWYDAASAGTEAGDAGDTYYPEENITLYAQYSAKTYTITLDDNGGTADGEATATYNSNKLTGISAPTYAGHSVVGYYKEAECTNLIADAAGNLQVSTDYTDGSGNWTTTSNQTLYAKWLAAISPALSYHVTTLNTAYITTANPTLTGNTGSGTVTYESSKPTVATVDASGVVTAVAAGTTTITANIASNAGYAAGSATCGITVLDAEVTDLYIFKKGSGYGGSGKCVSSDDANQTANADKTSATGAYSTYGVTGSNGMDRPSDAGTTVTYTFTVTQSNYAISSICTYGKLEEPAGAQYSWDGGKTWNPLSKYSESKMYFGAPADTYPTSFIIKYVGISTSSGGLYWRNALVTMVPAPHILSLTAGKWASFCPSYNVTIPANVTAYKASINGAKDEITATAIDGGIIPAAEGVLLKASADGNYTFAQTATSSSVSDNFLKGTTERTSSSTLTGPGEYLMALLKNEDKFVHYTGSNFPANRAYFAIVPPASAPSAIRIVEEGNNATSIMNVEATDEAVKFIEDGKLFIKKNGVVYDAMGRAVR